MQEATGEQAVPSITSKDKQEYYAQSEAAKSATSPVMTRQEMTKACADMGLAVGTSGDFISVVIDTRRLQQRPAMER